MPRRGWSTLASAITLAWVIACRSASAPSSESSSTTGSGSSSTSTSTSTSSGDTTTTSGSTGESTGSADSTSGESTGGDVCDVEPPAIEQAVETMAEVVCTKAASCECRHYDLATCFVDTRDGLLGWWDDAIAAGLEYDGTCMARRLARIEGESCEVDGENECAPVPCTAFHGDEARGAPCSVVRTYWADDCDQGLVCGANGECGDWDATVPIVGLGEPCFDPDAATVAYCDRGLACDYYGTNVCYDAPQVGEPCESVNCDAGAWCDEEDDDGPVCKAPRPGGAACDDFLQCESFECVLGICEPEEASLCLALL